MTYTANDEYRGERGGAATGDAELVESSRGGSLVSCWEARAKGMVGGGGDRGRAGQQEGYEAVGVVT